MAAPLTEADVLEPLGLNRWDQVPGHNVQTSAVAALEDGKVVYLPELAFALSSDEAKFLSPKFADERSKNVSFDPATEKAKHAIGTDAEIAGITTMMKRYHDYTLAFVRALAPAYAKSIRSGRTSFRPVEVRGRSLSPRKDDSRLHVDAFPSTPMAGTRILRVFTNVNPDGKPREWRLGSPFGEVVQNFTPRIGRQMPGSGWFLNAIGATKSVRTPYDHLMLNIHDTMKSDDAYQASVPQIRFDFPAGSTWLVFTDKASHAAMGGQHMFEQTFYLPVTSMVDEAKTPLRALEQFIGRALV